MLKAILVDDDFPVLRYLAGAVQWHDLGIQLAGSFSNGLEAWEAAGEDPPDIIVTDIGMPKMNGLEMLNKFLSVKPDAKAVILSCHNEFKYAQQAIKLNVSDYILKESLDVADLQDILKRMADELAERKQRYADIVQYKQKQTMNVSALKEKFLKETLFQSSWPKEDWIARAASFGVSLNAKWHVPLLLVINRMPELSKSREMNEYTIAFSVENVLQDVLPPEKWPIFRYSNNQLVVLCRTDNPEGELGQIHVAMRDGIAAIIRYLRFNVTCIMGRPARNPKELREILLPMLKEREHAFYIKETGIHRFEVKAFAKGDIFAEYAEVFSSVNKSVALNQQEE
ncbi:response regulator [Paenibacillus sp. 2TAB19]|uniref:response regulator n=1 Tax=Paenibacillus sp. 2TAB19 TaxID=3233003 RepID=UPI003F988C8E